MDKRVDPNPESMHHPLLVDAVKSPRQAAVFLTLGLPLAKPGIFILYDAEHPKESTGGVAHFLFQSNLANAVRQYLRTYDEGQADAELENFLETHKGKNPELDQFIRELEPLIRDALIVHGRKFIDNYVVVVTTLKSEVAAYVKTGGTPVYDQYGREAGIQDFKLKGVKLT